MKLHDETPIAIRDLPNILPKRAGKRVHLATVYRWLQRGIRGVRLESFCIGGGRYTTREALDRFNEAIAAAKSGGPLPVHEISRRSASRREREIAQAEADLDRAGVK